MAVTIVSTPKKNTFLNLGFAFVAMLLLNGVLIFKMSAFSGSLTLYFLLLVVSFLGMMLWLQKFLVRYQQITVTETQVSVLHKLPGKQSVYPFTDLKQWQEVSIKTLFQTYREILIDFGKTGKVKFSFQEQEEYEKIKAFLQKKHGGKKKK